MAGTQKKGAKEVAPEVAAKPKAPKKARDFGKEIDALKDLMRRNGWTV